MDGQTTFLPNVDRDGKLAFLRDLTLFSVPSRYPEAFGLYVVEALAAGVPVVLPHAGAFPEIIEATEGGLLYQPEEPSALPDALENLLLMQWHTKLIVRFKNFRINIGQGFIRI